VPICLDTLVTKTANCDRKIDRKFEHGLGYDKKNYFLQCDLQR